MSNFWESDLEKAEKNLVKGEIEEAKNIFYSVLAVFPESERAIEGLKQIQHSSKLTKPRKISLTQDKMQEVVKLYNAGQLWAVIQKVEEITLHSVPNIMLYNLAAAAHARLKNLDQAIENFKKVLEINPNDAAAFYNIGNIYKDKEEYDLEIEYYNKALSIKPDHAESYNNMGNALKNKGDFDGAITQFTNAIKIKTGFAEAHYNLGVVLEEQGDFNTSLHQYRKAAEIKPNYFKAHLNVGNILMQSGDLKPAIESYGQAIKINANYANAYFNMGVALMGLGNLDAAIESYRQAIKIKPEYAEAHLNMGIVLSDKGEFDAAMASYKKAIKIKSDYAEAYNGLGNVLAEKGELDAAVKSFEKSLEIKPSFAETFYNLGVVLGNAGKIKVAIENYKKAIQIKPNYVEAYTNLGVALRDKGKPAAAIECYRQAIKIKPDYAVAHYNMGIALKEVGEVNAAITSYEQAIKIKPDYADANLNQSLAYLCKEDFNSGWAKFDWRWKMKSHTNVPLESNRPRWTPSDNNRVLLWAEQGIGDEIMFASIIQDLHAACSKLIVKIDKRLIPLFKRSFPDDIDFRPRNEVVSEAEYDAHIPMGSMPKYFRQTADSFKPTSKGWLSACDAKANRLRKTLLSDGSETLIGISWHSTKPRSGAEAKVMTLTQLAKKLHAPKVKLINLQYGDVDSELDCLWKEHGIEVVKVPEIDNKADIDGLASLIMACDKVVSISNVTIHLAGALGKEAQVLLAYLSDWRWGSQPNNSYWYRSVLPYRQTKAGDWDNVLKKL